MSILKNYPLKHIDGTTASELIIRVNLVDNSLREIKEEIGRKANADRGFLYIRRDNHAPLRVVTFTFDEMLQSDERKHLENGNWILFWGSP